MYRTTYDYKLSLLQFSNFCKSISCSLRKSKDHSVHDKKREKLFGSYIFYSSRIICTISSNNIIYVSTCYLFVKTREGKECTSAELLTDKRTDVMYTLAAQNILRKEFPPLHREFWSKTRSRWILRAITAQAGFAVESSYGSRPGAIFHRDKAFSNDAGLALATAIRQDHAILTTESQRRVICLHNLFRRGWAPLTDSCSDHVR